MNRPEFDECIEMLRSSDSMIFEDGYHWLQGYLNEYIDQLVQLMLGETDPNIRSRLVELLGNSRNPKVIHFIEAELKSPHREVRSWAYSSLLYFEEPEAERLAKKFRQAHPDEEFL